jgi:hypothetical protein
MQAASQPSDHAHAEWFTATGCAHRDVGGKDPARGARTTITVEAGARSTWLAYPMGRTLIVIDGCGHVERQGGAGEQIRPGDALCSRMTFPAAQARSPSCRTLLLTATVLLVRFLGRPGSA